MASNGRPAVADRTVSVTREASVGVYVHIPFCERVCPYCDFAVVGAREIAPEVEARYVAALEREIVARRAAFAGARLETLYFGGGTPSLFRAESIARVIAAARTAFDAPELPSEITLEVNPSTVERERLPAFRAAGVDRLSLGIQSFDDTTLKKLGRAHKAEESAATISAARAAGFENLSLDLIVACPGQGLEAYERDLARALEARPEHLSLYELTIEAGTPFELAASRNQLERPDEDRTTRMLERTAERCAEAGYARYEVSNYARPGFASRHNQRYWTRAPVLGLGMGAWSYEPPGVEHPHGARRMNPRDLERYLRGVETNEDTAVEHDVLDAAQARGEAVFLALRRMQGLEAAGFEAEFGAPPRAFYDEPIGRLCAAGLLVESPAGDLRLTEAGLLLSDTVFADFV